MREKESSGKGHVESDVIFNQEVTDSVEGSSLLNDSLRQILTDVDWNSIVYQGLLCFVGGQDLRFVRVVMQLYYNHAGFVVASRSPRRPVGSVQLHSPVLCVQVQSLSQPGFEEVDGLSSLDPLF